jgi:hypothetical protein
VATFAQIAKAVRAPARTLILEPWVFADEWDGKPKGNVCVGLRLLSEADKSKARGEAEKSADDLHPQRSVNWTDAFNDAVMRQVGALGICDPNDVTRPTGVLPYAEEQVRVALTSRGTRFLFESLERYEIESSPIGEEVDAATLRELSERIAIVSIATVKPSVRRLAHHVLEELRAVTDLPEPDQ